MVGPNWLATGLFVAPAVGGREPKGQRFLVNVLFAALLVIVVGSMAGEWLSVQQKLHETPGSGSAIKVTNRRLRDARPGSDALLHARPDAR